MPTLHVLLKREELDVTRLAGKAIVVLDVLFATTTIVDAFHRGVACVHPVRNEEEATGLAARLGTCVLAGEHMARPIPGFGPATPLALADVAMRDAQMVYSTTNGTPALAAAAQATDAQVYAGALLNGRALAAHIAAEHAQKTVLLVCCGSVNRFNLEDFHGAGHIIEHLMRLGDYALTDAAYAALHAYRGCDSRTALFASRVGRLMNEHALGDEVEFACRSDSVDAVPMLVDGRLVDACAVRVAA